MINFNKGAFNIISTHDKSKNPDSFYISTDKPGFWLGDIRLDGMYTEKSNENKYMNILFCDNTEGTKNELKFSDIKLNPFLGTISMGTVSPGAMKHSLVIGENLVLSENNSLAVGTHNKDMQGQLFSIGIGSANSKKNAVSVLKDGSIYIQVNGTETKLQDVLSNDAEIKVINNGTSNTTAELLPNVFYVWGTVPQLDITLTPPKNINSYNQYMFQFTSGESTQLIMPNNITWLNNEPVVIGKNKTYQISIVNNLAVSGVFFK